MDKSFDCPECGAMVFQDDLKCPRCNARLRYRTIEEACKWPASGIFDLIPGIRDLPSVAMVIIRLALIIGLYLLVIGLRYIPVIPDVVREYLHLSLLCMAGLLVVMPVVRYSAHWIEGIAGR
jgi:hypothetical protein